MARLSPEAVLRTHQICRYADVVNMLDRYGFEVREGNNPNSLASHPEHDDLRFTVNKSPDKRDYQHNAAKACLTVLEREAAQEATIETEQDESFPQDMTVRTRGNTMILRHKDFPVIGMALNFDPDKNGLAEIATRRASTLRERATQLKDLIHTAEADHSIAVQQDNGSLVIAPLPGAGEDGIEVVIPPFNILTNEDPVEIMDDAIASSEEDIRKSNQFWDSIRDNNMASEFVLDTESERPSATFVSKNGVTGKKTTITTPVSPQGVISDRDQSRVVYEHLAHTFAEGTFKALQEEYGIITTGKSGKTLRLRHPIFEDLDIRVPNPRPILDSISVAFKGSVDGTSREISFEQIEETLDAATESWNLISLIASEAAKGIEESRPYSAAWEKSIGNLGVKSRDDGYKKLGAPYTLRLAGGPNDSITYSCPASKIKTGRTKETLVAPERRQEIQDFLRRVKDSFKPSPAAEPPKSIAEMYSRDDGPKSLDDALGSILNPKPEA